MTIAIDNSGGKVLYPSNGVQTNYTFSFKVLNINDLKVYEDGIISAGNIQVNLNADQNASPGGSIDYLTSTEPANGVIILIKREVDIEQEADYSAYGGFPPETHELALDNLTQIVQQLEENVDRSLLAKIDDDGTTNFTLPSYTARRALVWDSVAKKLVNSTSDPDDQSGAAAASAADAAASAVSADNSFQLANTEAIAAQASRVATDALYTAFLDLYLGPFAADPALDNSGNALGAGDLYYNTVVPEMRVYNGSAWNTAYNAGLGISDNGTANGLTVDGANNVSVTNNLLVNKATNILGTTNVESFGQEPPISAGTANALTLNIPNYSGSGIRIYSFYCSATNTAINPKMDINGTGSVFLIYVSPVSGALRTFSPFQLKAGATYHLMNNGGANYIILNPYPLYEYSVVYRSAVTGLIGLGSYNVPFDTTLYFSVDDFYNATFSRWEPNVRGLWCIEASIQLSGCIAGDSVSISIIEDGSAIRESVGYADGTKHTLTISYTFELTSVAKQFKIAVQNSTTSVSIAENSIRNWASMRLIKEH